MLRYICRFILCWTLLTQDEIELWVFIMNLYYKSILLLNCPVTVYIQSTSRKRPPNISSPGGRLLEVVAYESLDHIG